MKQKVKVVFDANIYLSAIIFGGNPRQCLELAKKGDIELFTSNAILLEVARNLQNKFGWSAEEVKEVIKGIGEFAILVSPQVIVKVIQTYPKDNKILEAAQEAKAEYIISGDKKHLLSLKKFKNIEIISAKDFLDLYYEN
ncbi:putative toxin-antitoxin system toxin component, PIN family [Candidatus Daviesbacteria bacterium]|nr:putative toxin-antitoxin system toxin component, PIN family [Candidatus Daviesbacteria bacterium]